MRFSLWSGGRRRALTGMLMLALGGGFGSFSVAWAQCSDHPWADFVVESSPTTGDPSWVLGELDGLFTDFENDGPAPGFVIVGFTDDVIVDGPGDDFAIHVYDFAASETVESFELFVSEDGANWVSLGIVAPTSPFQNQPEALTFDLAGSGVAAVTRISVLNTTVDEQHTREGVDIDAFRGLHCASPTAGDLMQCEDDLDACAGELLTCEGELDDALAAGESCAGELDTCETDLDEAAAGLRELVRLLGLPRGQRSSDFACSGALCARTLQAIEMLLDPPGQNVQGHGRNHKR